MDNTILNQSSSVDFFKGQSFVVRKDVVKFIFDNYEIQKQLKFEKSAVKGYNNQNARTVKVICFKLNCQFKIVCRQGIRYCLSSLEDLNQI